MEKMKLHNYFRIVATDVTTKETKEIARAENIVLDYFYKRMMAFSGGPQIGGIAVGSGTTPPSKTDTNLTNRLLNKNFTNSVVINTSRYGVGGDGVVTYTGNIVINANELVGSTISEVGLIDTNNAGHPVITKALLTDVNGNPIQIVKTDTMVLTIYATAYTQFPKTVSGFNMPGKLTISGAVQHWPSSGISFRNRYIGKDWSEQNSSPASLEAFNASCSLSDDTVNNIRTYTVPEVAAGSANLNGGIRSVLIGGVIEIPVPNETFQQSVITKEVVGTGDGTKTKFATAFGWIRDNGTLKVYINDVEVISGVTTRYNVPPPSAWKAYFQSVEGQPTSGPFVWENVSGLPVIKYQAYAGYGDALSCSNDLASWVVLQPEGFAFTKDIPAEYQSYKYWKVQKTFVEGTFTLEPEHITFDTAPAPGATVSVTYQPDCIAKNSDKIMKNMSYKLQMPL